MPADPAEAVAILGEYAAAGIAHVMVWLDPGTVAGVEAFALSARLGMAFAILTSTLTVIGAQVGGLRGAVLALPVSGALQCLVQEVLLRARLREHGIPTSAGDWAMTASLYTSPSSFSISAYRSSMLSGVSFRLW